MSFRYSFLPIKKLGGGQVRHLPRIDALEDGIHYITINQNTRQCLSPLPPLGTEPFRTTELYLSTGTFSSVKIELETTVSIFKYAPINNLIIYVYFILKSTCGGIIACKYIQQFIWSFSRHSFYLRTYRAVLTQSFK